MHLTIGLIIIILALVVIVRRLGLFERSFDVNTFFMFTYLSTFLCWLFYSVELFFIEENATFSCLKFYLMIYELLVMFVYNVILVPQEKKNHVDSEHYNFYDCVVHIAIPVLVTFDYFSYTVHYVYPLYTAFASLMYPILYGIAVFFKGVLKFGKEYRHSKNYYPYFFLDLEKIGVKQVASNCVLLVSCVAVFAIVFLIINNLFLIPKKELLAVLMGI